MTLSPPSAPVAEPLRIGDLSIIPIRDGQIRLPPAELWTMSAEFSGQQLIGRGGTVDDWTEYPQFLHPDGTIEFTLGGYLVVGNGRVTLVDAGQGPEPFGPAIGGELPASLTAVGYRPEDVTDVVFTHLHRDHTGWASIDGKPFFPSAVYRCHADDVAYFSSQHSLGAVGPIVDRIETWTGDVTILPGIDTQHAPGHTPGSSLIVISSGSERAVLIGDTVHCPAELVDAEWSGVADVDPVLAAATRQALARELESTGTPTAAAHFPGLSFGRVLSRESHSWAYLGNY